MPTQNETLTAIAGVRVGHAQDQEALTGCTVVLLPEGCCCGVDVRGGAPGTRETDLLSPTAMVQHINALCLTGGSAFGLASATGVVQWLYERGIGFDTGAARVPIVPAAVIYDLALGSPARWPDAAMGYAACDAATAEPVAEGSVGAGTGAAVGKLLGIGRATKGGLGSAALRLPDGTTVAALAVTNAFGDVYRDRSATILAGARDPQGGFAGAARLLTAGDGPRFGGMNTTLGVVITDALLDKAGCTRLAQMAQDALARTIRPIHTPFDGDIVFAAATGTRPALHLAALGTAAADALAAAIERSVLTATALGGLPAAGELE
ncbi:MAG TPA: P1 family peptidase [Roseiflexaceae bacterium]|nr:P1 family peptidase [Roseiflexaceae bacterium]